MDNASKDIFFRDRNGDTIHLDDPEYPRLLQVIHKAIRITSKLNNLVINDLAELNVLFGELIGKKVDDTFFMIPPDHYQSSFESDGKDGEDLTPHSN